MAEVLLFHHAQGLTPGIRAFADDLRADGHIVHTPDLFGGRIFPSIEEGLAYIEKIGFDDLRKCGVRMADGLPFDLVYAGFSFGVLPAHQAGRALGLVELDDAVLIPVKGFGRADGHAGPALVADADVPACSRIRNHDTGKSRVLFLEVGLGTGFHALAAVDALFRVRLEPPQKNPPLIDIDGKTPPSTVRLSIQKGQSKRKFAQTLSIDDA